MIVLERTSVMNLENAMRGARNPMNSWGRMDSFYDEDGNFVLGPNDLDLAKRLRKAGSDHFCFRGYYGTIILVEGIRYLQSGNRGKFHQYDAQDPQQTI